MKHKKKHRNIRKINPTKLILTGLLLLFLITAMSVPVFAASNKGAQLKLSFNAAKENETPEDREQNTYSLRLQLLKKAKLAKTSTLSARILIPKKIFQADGDKLTLEMNMSYNKEGKNKEPLYAGNIVGRYAVGVERHGKKVELTQFDFVKQQPVQKAACTSLKKSGSNYVLTFKNIPFQSVCLEGQGTETQEKEINTKKKYLLVPTLTFIGHFAKNTSASVNIDELSVKTNITQKVNFSKNEYIDLERHSH